jgi:hypothetical protein
MPELIRLQNTDDNEIVRRRAFDLARNYQGESGGTPIRSVIVWTLGIVLIAGIIVVFFKTRGADRAPKHSR